ncbi:flavin-containing amine oxidoreductase-domain containing protein [Cryomyces antarcticus]
MPTTLISDMIPDIQTSTIGNGDISLDNNHSFFDNAYEQASARTSTDTAFDFGGDGTQDDPLPSTDKVGSYQSRDDSSLSSFDFNEFNDISKFKTRMSQQEADDARGNGSLGVTEDTGLSSVSPGQPLDEKENFYEFPLPKLETGQRVDSNDTGSQKLGSAIEVASPAIASFESSTYGGRDAQDDVFYTPKTSIREPSEATPERKASIGLKPVLNTFTPPCDSHRTTQGPAKKRKIDPRPKSSIPSALCPEEYARQGKLAAYSSRLSPYVLHPAEYSLLRGHITQAQVTTYLNIRNGILRLWTRNPMVSVTRQEAAGCARESRYFLLADIAYEWLLRQGYINFGCVEVPITAGPISRAKAKGRRRTVVIIGAGMAGLGCARQLEGLFAQLGDRWTQDGERRPRVVILEGRSRVGGRVYSHPLRTQVPGSLPNGLRNTAEMGAMIITGFEHGNPLNAIIRGQLALHYHRMKDDSRLYDVDGSKVKRRRDALVEKLYNDILERVSVYRTNAPPPQTAEGDKRPIDWGRDPTSDSGKPMSSVEDTGGFIAVLDPLKVPAKSNTVKHIPAGLDKLTGKAHLVTGSTSNAPAAQVAEAMGWKLKQNITKAHSVALDSFVQACDHPTLGGTMDEAIRQYQEVLNVTSQDLRLLNWHHANFEYANAALVGELSLGSWDQDIGNEFEGEHCEIIGGYTQVPRGLWQCPTALDVRFGLTVQSVHYDPGSIGPGGPATVVCDDGEQFEADRVVITTPLGVLKEGSIRFEPPLPDWKSGAIERLGFGLLNKIVLVYEKRFWEEHRDMFGLLNEPELLDSLNQKDYASKRGRYYLFWNCMKISGRPMLIALMAGNAAYQTEDSDTNSLIKEVTNRLARTFAPMKVPAPAEVIVTRWKRDPFARGTYSYMGPKARPGDYDTMALPLGNLHFAGEATCGTHPATVHGAYLSGLRAASEIVEQMIGPIHVPTPLVPVTTRAETVPNTPTSSVGNKNRSESTARLSSRDNRQTQNEDYEASIIGAILSEIGERPIKPGRSGINPFLLYQKDHWFICKAQCDAARKEQSGNGGLKPSKEQVRVALGQMWHNADSETKRPYLEQSTRARELADVLRAEYEKNVAVWDREAARIRREHKAQHPLQPGEGEVFAGKTAIEYGHGRRHRNISSYAEDSDDAD